MNSSNFQIFHLHFFLFVLYFSYAYHNHIILYSNYLERILLYMLKVYICPVCQSVRYVSKENITCHRCSCSMILSGTSYADFIHFNVEQRIGCINHTLQKINNPSDF